MVMQATGETAEQGLAQTHPLDLQGIAIDEEVVDEVLDEMAIETSLSLETQRWLVFRSMAAASLAATVRLDEDYYRALAALGDGPAPGDEYEFAVEFLSKFAADVVEAFGEADPNGAVLVADLSRRLSDRDAILGLLHVRFLND